VRALGDDRHVPGELIGGGRGAHAGGEQ
jgi:hypothetical protein